MTPPAANHYFGSRRLWRRLCWFVLGMVLLLFLTFSALAGLFSRYDDPKRLGAEVHVTSTNGFTLRWAAHQVPDANCDLVFVHGSPGGAGVWQSQFAQPFSRANLIAYDRPGYGGSKPVLGQPHLQDQVNGLMTLLGQAATNRVLLVGHSYGSPICLLAALEHPERIGGVLLIGGDVDPAQEKPWFIEYLFEWRIDSWLLPRKLRQCNREMLTVGGDLTAMQSLLPQLIVPVVMLHGDRDPLVPVENVAWLEQQLATVGKTNLFTKIILPGYNHFIPWEHPADVAAAIKVLQEKSHIPPVSRL